MYIEGLLNRIENMNLDKKEEKDVKKVVLDAAREYLRLLSMDKINERMMYSSFVFDTNWVVPEYDSLKQMSIFTIKVNAVRMVRRDEGIVYEPADYSTVQFPTALFIKSDYEKDYIYKK